VDDRSYADNQIDFLFTITSKFISGSHVKSCARLDWCENIGSISGKQEAFGNQKFPVRSCRDEIVDYFHRVFQYRGKALAGAVILNHVYVNINRKQK